MLWTRNTKALRQRRRSTSRRWGGLSASPNQAVSAPLPENDLEEIDFSALLLQEQLVAQGVNWERLI